MRIVSGELEGGGSHGTHQGVRMKNSNMVRHSHFFQYIQFLGQYRRTQNLDTLLRIHSKDDMIELPFPPIRSEQ